jgi:hypothetical protein
MYLVQRIREDTKGWYDSRNTNTGRFYLLGPRRVGSYPPLYHGNGVSIGVAGNQGAKNLNVTNLSR